VTGRSGEAVQQGAGIALRDALHIHQLLDDLFECFVVELAAREWSCAIRSIID
jgi:hypothetical protein